MTSPRITEAEALADRITAAFAAADLRKAFGTVNAGEVPSGARHGVAVVTPPTLDFDGPWGESTPHWEFYLVAGSSSNYLAAWETLDRMLEALLNADFNMKRAEPASYEPIRGEALPAYTVTLNPLD